MKQRQQLETMKLGFLWYESAHKEMCEKNAIKEAS